jgi:endonuclease/exonuclease/phosphatase (EEP) superfamily protein YafD
MFTALVGAYGLSVTLYLLARLLFPGSSLLDLFDNGLHLLILPAPLALLLSLLLRRFAPVPVLVLPVLACLLTYAPSFLPGRVAAAPPDAPRLTVLTFNIMSWGPNVEPLVAIMRDADADVIALQEVSEDAAARLIPLLEDIYPYHALHPQPGEPIPGQGIFSRYPITEDDYWRVHLGHQRVVIDFAGQPVPIYNAHPVHPFGRLDRLEDRREDLESVLVRVERESGPLILLGDFNMTEQTDVYQRTVAGRTDAFRAVGWGLGFTWPTTRTFGFLPPYARIDYIFYSPHWRALSAEVLPDSAGPDHLPLRAELVLVATGQGVE